MGSAASIRGALCFHDVSPDCRWVWGSPYPPQHANERRRIEHGRIAADGVASVELLDRNGATVERLPVHANVYGAESLPTMTGVRLVALDERGNALGDATP
jgi:hypothetical protein